MKDGNLLRSDYWSAPSYELALRSPVQGNVQALLPLMTALWSSPQVLGPWHKREDIGTATIAKLSVESEELNFRYGVLHINERVSIDFNTVTFEEFANGFSWLCLCIPSGMFYKHFPLRYLLGHSNNSWLQEIDAALLRLAAHTFRSAPFPVGLIGEEALGIVGEEVDALTSELLLQSQGLDRGGVLVASSFLGSPARAKGAEELTSGLLWFPRTD